MKYLKLLLATAALALITLTTSNAGFPTFHPDLGCVSLGSVTRTFDKVGSGTYTQSYHRFKVRASTTVSTGWVEVDCWIDGQGGNAWAAYYERNNNLGGSVPCNYNAMRAYAGLIPDVTNMAYSWNWFVDSNNGGTVDWEQWVDDESTDCNDSSDGPLWVAFWDANGYSLGFATIDDWDPEYTNGNGYTVPANIIAWYSMYHPGSRNYNARKLGLLSWNPRSMTLAMSDMDAAYGGWQLIK